MLFVMDVHSSASVKPEQRVGYRVLFYCAHLKCAIVESDVTGFIFELVRKQALLIEVTEVTLFIILQALCCGRRFCGQ